MHAFRRRERNFMNLISETDTDITQNFLSTPAYAQNIGLRCERKSQHNFTFAFFSYFPRIHIMCVQSVMFVLYYVYIHKYISSHCRKGHLTQYTNNNNNNNQSFTNNIQCFNGNAKTLIFHVNFNSIHYVFIHFSCQSKCKKKTKKNEYEYECKNTTF